MKVSTERIPESQVLMTIEVEDDRLETARKAALRRLSPKAKVPGFRPGKAPPNLVRQYFGEERILDEALDELVPVVYREAIEADESIFPVARPRLVIETTEPLVVKATIPVRPNVELNDWQAVRVPLEEAAVDEERVEEAMLALRRRGATLEPHEGEIGWRDVIRIEVEAKIEDDELIGKQEAEVQLLEDKTLVFPGFSEALIGKKKGDELEFDLDVPAGVGDDKYAGKQAHFKVHVIETKAEVLPELDGEFTKSVGDGYETPDALSERIRNDLMKHEEEQRDNRYHDAILAGLVERATVEFPPVMLDAEVDRMLHDQFGHIQHEANFAQYLASMGRTEEDLRNELRPVADTRLRRSLVLGKVADAEDIKVTDEDVAEELQKMVDAAGAQAPQLRQMIESDEGRDTIRRNLMTRKTLARLVEIATQDAGAPAPGAVETTAKKTAAAATRKTPAKKKSAKAEAAATDADNDRGEGSPASEGQTI